MHYGARQISIALAQICAEVLVPQFELVLENFEIRRALLQNSAGGGIHIENPCG